MTDSSPKPINVDSAYQSYETRFEQVFGPKPPGAFGKFAKTMIQRLSREDFAERLQSYLTWHKECKSLIGSGATISDALVMGFEEASAWLIIEPPRILDMFCGELGIPEERVASTDPNRPPSPLD